MKFAVAFCAVVLITAQSAAAQSLDQIVAEAKEGEVTLIASSSTFGGKGFAELRPDSINVSTESQSQRWAASFPQVAGRIVVEIKAGAKSSTDMYLVRWHPVHCIRESVAEVTFAGTFPGSPRN
jgi:hypothetical protein